LPVEVAFQFPLVVRPVSELSGRYSARKLMTAMAQPGQEQPFTNSANPSFERSLYTETRRTSYTCSATATSIGWPFQTAMNWQAALQQRIVLNHSQSKRHKQGFHWAINESTFSHQSADR
jgi:hypothetical protein